MSKLVQKLQPLGRTSPLARKVDVRAKPSRSKRHRQADHYERQAESFANVMGKDFRRPAMHISARAAARPQVAASAGNELPVKLRREFELAFGADFRAVRIHTSSAAHEAAVGFGAEAFTSGTNIYFRNGSFDPHFDRGRRLLVHELTHVLQQTGRRNGDGRLIATPLSGTGEVQCRDDEFVPKAAQVHLFDPPLDWAAIKAAYVSVRDVAPHIAIIEKLLPSTLPASASLRLQFHSLVFDGNFKALPNEIKGLYVDALKLVGAFADAQYVLVQYPNVPTAYRSQQFYEYVREEPLNWMAKFASTDSFTKTYYPDRLIAVYEAFLFMPAAQPLDLDPGSRAKTFTKKLEDEINRIRTTKGLKDNELRATMLLAFYNLDEHRFTVMGNALKPVLGPMSILAISSGVAEMYRTGIGEALAPDDAREVVALFDGVLPKIKETAVKAALLWNRVIDLRAAIEAGTGFREFNAAEVKSMARGMGSEKKFARMRSLLLECQQQLLVRPGGNLISPSTFAARVQKYRGELAAAVVTYSKELWGLVPTEKHKEPDGLRLSLAIAFLSNVEYELARYNSKRDVELTKKKTADERVGARIRLAKDLKTIGKTIGWYTLESSADDVFKEELQVALLDDWKEDQTVSLGSLSRDVGQIGEAGSKITGPLLEKFAFIHYYIAVRVAIENLLQNPPFSPKHHLYKRGLSEAKDIVKLPRRFVIEKWQAIEPPDSKTADPKTKRAKLSDKLFEHPLTRELVLKEGTPDDWFLTNGTAPEAEEPLVFWIVPNKKKFVFAIDQLPVVSTTVEVYWKKNKKGDPPDPVTESYEWLQAFEAALESLSDEKQKNDVQEALVKEIAGRVERAENEEVAAIKNAVNFQRLQVGDYLKTKLTEIAAEDGKQWWSGDEIFKTIVLFAQDVFPRDDEAKQVAALTLEIAGYLQKAFSDTERHNVIEGLLTLSWAVLNEWEQNSAAILDISPLSKFELLAGVVILKSFRDKFSKYAEERQKRRGLHGNKGKELRSVLSDAESWLLIRWKMQFTSISEKQAFDWAGDDYVLEEVYEDFTFYPEFGDFMDTDWKSSEGHPKPGSAILVDGEGKVVEHPTGRKLFSITKKPFDGPPITKVVTDKDKDELERYHDMVEGVLVFEYIAAGGRFLEWYAGALADVIELLPGIGQAVAFTRFTAAILQTLVDEDFRKLLAAFREDGFGAITKGFDALVQLVAPERLVALLLTLSFDTDFIEKAHHHKDLKGNQTRARELKSKGGPWSTIARLLLNVVRAGVLVLDRIKSLVHHVQTPVRSIQLWVLHHPAAALLLDLIDRNFYTLSELTLEDLADFPEQIADADWQQLIKDKTLEATNEVVLSASRVLDPLGLLELPEEVIPMEWVIDFVIDLVVKSFGGKYKKPIEAVRAVMRKIGIWDKILTVIKENVFVGPLDPNEVYREYVKTKFDGWFTGIRNAFAGEIADQLGKVPFVSVTQAKAQATGRAGISVDFNGLGFPEAETEGYQLQVDEIRPYLLLPSDLGSPGPRLPLSERLRAEAAFGHDLRHVRLHRGDRADRVTSALGAQAITSGSHVFLRSDVSLNNSKGRHVLNHELAHVVQQTGHRPLSGSFSDQPVEGRPYQGLRWEPRREAAADYAAQKAARGEVASGPMALAGEQGGFQPFPDDLLRRFLQRLHSDADIVEARKEVRDSNKNISLSSDLKDLPAKLGKDIGSWLKRKGVFKDPFSTVQTELQSLAQSAWTEFTQSLPLLVARSVTTVAGKKEGKVRTTEEYLPAENLKVELERELFGATGMGFVIEFNEIAGPAAIKKRKIVNANDPIKSVSVVYVHLPLLPAGAAGESLWDLLVKNTYKGTKDYNAAAHDSFKAVVKLILGRGTPSPDIFDRDSFKLSYRRATVIRNQRDRLMEFVDKNKKWPDVSDYTNDAKVSTAGVENLGLRVGTYKDWRSSKLTGVQDRDAHHTVQFLLLEYFRNFKARKPFPFLGDESYPGVHPDGKTKQVQTIDGPGKKSISVGKYFDEHGEIMTTIYLARHTHQSGIHYRSEPPDEDDTGRATQGNSIDAAFDDKLKNYSWLKSKDPAVRPVLAALAKHAAAQKLDEPVPPSISKVTDGATGPITVKRTSEAIFKATQETYKDMWTEMKPKLKHGLEVQEVAYYNSIAKLRSMTEMKSGDSTAIFKTVTTRTETEIGTKAGFSA